MSNRRKTRVSINSKHLTGGGDPTDFFVPLDAIHDIFQVEILNISIPNTLYNVNSHNNVIPWIELGSTAYNSTIAAGNYTSAEILTSIKSAMELSGAGTITASIGANTEKITVASTNSFEFTFGTNTTNSMAALLGYADTDTGAGVSHLADNVFDLSYTHNIYIESDIARKFDDKIINTTGNYRPILSVVNRDTSYGSLLHENPNTRISYRANIGQIRGIHIQLKDDLNRPLGGTTGLNGRHFSLDLLIHHLIN